MRGSVADVMTEIPRILDREKKCLDIYKAIPRDSLNKASAELFKAVLITLCMVVEYLTANSFRECATRIRRGFSTNVRRERG